MGKVLYLVRITEREGQLECVTDHTTEDEKEAHDVFHSAPQGLSAGGTVQLFHCIETDWVEKAGA